MTSDSKRKILKRYSRFYGFRTSHLINCWLCFAIVVLGTICVYLIFWNIYYGVASQKRWITSINVDNFDTEDPLWAYGLYKDEPEPKIWLTIRESLKSLQKRTNLWSGAEFDDDESQFEFSSLETLMHHIMFVENEWFRFSTHRSRMMLTETEHAAKLKQYLVSMQHNMREYHRVLSAELYSFYVRTGMRKTTRENLYKLKVRLKEEIERLQHKVNCRKAIICRVSNIYGFSSGIHDYLWCIIRGFQLKRRVVFDNSRWHYLRETSNSSIDGSWTEYFQTINAPCNESDIHNDIILPGPQEQRESLHSMSGDVASVLVKYHRDPYAWWFGQFMTYIMRPSEKMQRKLASYKRRVNFRSPIVGVHIRRTDKIGEASYHAVDEYMSFVEEYFESIGAEETKIVRRIFLATDEPQIYYIIRNRYPRYHIVNDDLGAQIAKNYTTRAMPGAMEYILRDIYLLSECDFVVCTLSSGFCRVVYELMQGRRTDATLSLVSLDVEYFYAYVRPPPRRVLYPHAKSGGNFSVGSDMWLRVGDYVAHQTDMFAVNEARRKRYWDGNSVGVIDGSVLLGGTYPTYKTIPTVMVNGSNMAGTF